MKLNPCPKCSGNKFQHLIFVLQCVDCGEVSALPESDSTGLDFLTQRYTNPTENNAPGKDIAFVPMEIESE